MNQPVDPLTSLIQNVQDLVFAHSGTFTAIGLQLFAGFSAILVAWTGVEVALSGRGFDFGRFARMLLFISFGYAFVHYYDTPIPGIGQSFTGLITNEAKFLADEVGKRTIDELAKNVSEMMNGLTLPSALTQTSELAVYLVVIGGLSVLSAVAYVVVAFGIVAQGVLLLLGPIFVPFFIVPRMDWLFWGWLKAFMQYSFYQVVANAVIYIFGHTFMTLIGWNPNAPWTLEQLVRVWPATFIFLLVAILGILKVPQLTSNLFSGSAGGDSGLIQAVTGAVSRLAG